MSTKLYIMGEDAPLYTSKLDSLGFIFGPTPHSLCHFSNGELRISFDGHEPIYVYEDRGMIFIGEAPLTTAGPLLASWVPQKTVTA